MNDAYFTIYIGMFELSQVSTRLPDRSGMIEI